MGSPAAGWAADLSATWAAALTALLVEGLARGLAALGAGLARGLSGGSSLCGKQFASGTSRVEYNFPLAKPFASPHALAFLCVDSTQRSETGQVRGLRWHNRPREREGKECGEADGHGGLQRERPREGKGEGRGKVRARRKRKVKGW